MDEQVYWCVKWRCSKNDSWCWGTVMRCKTNAIGTMDREWYKIKRKAGDARCVKVTIQEVESE